MSQSTNDGQTPGQTPVPCSQISANDTCDQRLMLNYPDRQDEMVAESTDESFAAFTVEVPLSQTTDQCSTPVNSCPPPLAQSHARSFTEEEIRKVREDITEMNSRFTEHGYEAFVHNKMHLIFKIYPFDLE